jgi:hypothetical protein
VLATRPPASCRSWQPATPSSCGRACALDLQLSDEQRHRIDAAGEPYLGEPHVHNLDSDPLYFPGEHYPPAIPAA